MDNKSPRRRFAYKLHLKTDRLIKSSNGMEYFYDQTGVAGFKYAEETYFYIKDAQANIIAILDSNGDIVVEYTYDAWGNHTVSGSNVALGNRNPFRYRSYFYDPETRLYFLKTRYYDPEIGRFISPDSIDYADPMSLDGLNLYAYCNNNPVMNVDPTGQFVISGSALAFGVALAGTALLAWIESTFHPIQNLVKSIGDAIGDLINDISVSGSVNSSNSSSSLSQSNDLSFNANTSIFNNIYFSRERNRGHDSGFIGVSDQELEEMLNYAKRENDSKEIQRILKEMKIRGMRNARKQRGGPHMRVILLLLLGGWLDYSYENSK